MQDSPETVEAACDRFGELSADQTLTALDRARLATRRAEVDTLALAAHWADLHGELDRPASPPKSPTPPNQPPRPRPRSHPNARGHFGLPALAGLRSRACITMRDGGSRHG